MKTIGMLGGMSWESSLHYYRIVNQCVKERLGGFHSARCLMVSVDFHEIEGLMRSGDWAGAAAFMVEASLRVEKGGADFLIICTNTLHKVAGAVEDRLNIPLLHIADPTGKAVRSRGIEKVALLGTRFTMAQDFYRGKLARDHGLEVLLPTEPEMDAVHDIIFQELCLGTVREQSRDRYLAIVDRLVGQGAQGVILGCTEIGLLIQDGDREVPFFDTTELHARAAVDYALTP